MSQTGGRSSDSSPRSGTLKGIAWQRPPEADAPGGWLGGAGRGGGAAVDDRLHRALVAGLILEVILEQPGSFTDPGSERHRVKACLKTTLVSHLAGRIPLAAFRNLAQGLDRWFEDFYPLLSHAGMAGSSAPRPQREAPGGGVPLQVDRFRECLENSPGLLPKRRHRKLDPEKLRDFLEHTGDRWFKLKDFEGYFRVDRKTAWEYVQKLLQVGMLVHNQGHSSAVRYRVAPGLLALPSEKGSPFPQEAGSPLEPHLDGGVTFHL